jgi:hypothetical protein
MLWITPKGIAEVEKIASTNKPKNQVDQALNVSPNHPFIDENRLQELKEISSKPSKFDFSKLIKLCEELNSNYSNGKLLCDCHAYSCNHGSCTSYIW